MTLSRRIVAEFLGTAFLLAAAVGSGIMGQKLAGGNIAWGCARLRFEAVPIAVGLYITGAYWFTASTSFANPAVTLALGRVTSPNKTDETCTVRM